MSLLEGFKFRSKDTRIHKLDPRTKFIVVLVYTVLSLIFFEVIPLFIIFVSTIFLLYLAKSLGEWKKTMKGMIYFLIIIFILNFISIPENKFDYSLAMVLRFSVLTSIFSFFFLTTTPDELALAIEASGIPRDYSLMFTMSLRFVPTLAKDLQMIIDALRSRGLELEKGGIIKRVKNYTYVLIPLIVYEIRRSLMIAEALEARGYGAASKITPYYQLRMKRIDYFVSIGVLIVGLIVVLLKVKGLLPSLFYTRLFSI
ncbi:MAG: hypothetical protein B6U94_00415 [Thermofilum sp. ex4484_79]|nr:MAG: hypothetical protein B6U94_00415 [Thermofilum sp. ex4484_79]